MSIKDAIHRASQETLTAYLSPELCAQLTDEIVHRATAELESALQAFVGFDGLRAMPKAAAAKKGVGRRGRKPRAQQAEAREAAGGGDHAGEPEPSPEQMV